MMKIIAEQSTSKASSMSYLPDDMREKSLLFFDIETTGLSPEHAEVFLIGALRLSENGAELHQFFAETQSEEKEILEAFFSFAESYDLLIHFNGRRFDLPFIRKRCEILGIADRLSGKEDCDLYQRLRPYRSLLQMQSLKQKEIEELVGFPRADELSGSEMVGIYKEYLSSPSDSKARLLLLHNADDVKGMPFCMQTLLLEKLFSGRIDLEAVKAQANTYRALNGSIRKELFLHLKMPSPLPFPLHARSGDCYVKANGNILILRIPLYEEEMKYFYAGHQDYYYLPEEDTALHKSIANFVNKAYRVPATPSTCYTKKKSLFLKEWSDTFVPVFRRDYKDKERFFEVTPEIRKDRKALSSYAKMVLQQMR